jgi:hypothetical protein
MTDTSPLTLREHYDLPSLILTFMKTAQMMLGNNATDKKKFVLLKVRNYIGDAAYERYEPLINSTIDMLKTISKSPVILRGLESLEESCLKKITMCNFC